MVDFSGINASTTTQTDSAASRTRLSDNYDTFLILLTAQLQNQDPLAPMDSTQFTQQLVQFSQVEQQIRTNEQLEGLVGQYNAAAAGAALSYLGKDAIISASETYLAGGEANWAYRLPEAATSMTVSVKDMQGRTIYETNTAARGGGEHLFTWDGTTHRWQHSHRRRLSDRHRRKECIGQLNIPDHLCARNHHGRRLHWRHARRHHAFWHTRIERNSFRARERLRK